MRNIQKTMPLNIQLFADNGEGGVAQPQNAAQNTNQGANQEPSIDYDKIQGMIDSRNQKTEESVLKSYFQSQGMSADEMSEAIKTYKTQKEENSKKQANETTALQNQVQEANAKALQAEIKSEAIIQASELGIDKKTIPYLIKLADFSGVSNEKGEIDSEKVKEALNAVLTDIPSLKPNENKAKGIEIGANSSNANQNSGGDLFNFGFTGVRKH